MRSAAAARKTFADSKTTLAGIFHAHFATNPVSKVAWAVAFLGLLGATIWNTTMVVTDYLSYPIQTTVTMSYQTSVPFPTVTVCNRNPVQCSKLVNTYFDNKEALAHLLELSGCIETVTQPPLFFEVCTLQTHQFICSILAINTV